MVKDTEFSHHNSSQRCYDDPGIDLPKRDQLLFDNLPEIMRPAIAAEILGVSIKTIYDWRYRQKTRNIPDDLFIKFNRFLYIRTSALKKWMNRQNNILL